MNEMENRDMLITMLEEMYRSFDGMQVEVTIGETGLLLGEDDIKEFRNAIYAPSKVEINWCHRCRSGCKK